MKLAHPARLFFCSSLLALCLTLGAQHGTAAPLCQSGSLADYVALNSTGGCTFNELTFFRFAFSPAPVSTGGAALATAADIYLAPDTTEFGTGFSFTSSYFSLPAANVPQSVTYNIGYSVDPPPIIVGEELFLDPPYGDVTVSQRVCLNDVLANNCAFGVALQQSVTPVSPLSSISFPYAVPFVDIQDTITLRTTPGNPAGFDGLDTGTKVNTPEPGTWALGAMGILFGLAWKRRRA